MKMLWSTCGNNPEGVRKTPTQVMFSGQGRVRLEASPWEVRDGPCGVNRDGTQPLLSR